MVESLLVLRVSEKDTSEKMIDSSKAIDIERFPFRKESNLRRSFFSLMVHSIQKVDLRSYLFREKSENDILYQHRSQKYDI